MSPERFLVGCRQRLPAPRLREEANLHAPQRRPHVLLTSQHANPASARCCSPRSPFPYRGTAPAPCNVQGLQSPASSAAPELSAAGGRQGALSKKQSCPFSFVLSRMEARSTLSRLSIRFYYASYCATLWLNVVLQTLAYQFRPHDCVKLGCMELAAVTRTVRLHEFHLASRKLYRALIALQKTRHCMR